MDVAFLGGVRTAWILDGCFESELAGGGQIGKGCVWLFGID